MNGWGMALRIAWRDLRRHKLRSALVVTLVALPVLVVSTAAIVAMTAEVRGVEALDRTLGAAEAKIWTDGPYPVLQRPDPDDGITNRFEEATDGAEEREAPGATEIAAAVQDGVEVVPVAQMWSDVLQPNGDLVSVEFREGDFTSPVLKGLVELVEGRMAEASHEVVVTDALRREGFGIGDTLPTLEATKAPVVVGVVEDATYLDEAVAYGPAGSLMRATDAMNTSWFVGGSEVTWDDVLALNELGFVVASRAVVTDPPPADEVLYEEYAYSGGENTEAIAVVAMIVAIVLIEVVLLAGPAFAVTARNHTRTLALVAASGGTPRQARRVILAGALVLGLVATVGALLLSLLVAFAVLPLAQKLSYERLGPYDVPWLWLLAFGAFGLASALLAAVVPAWLTSRQDPVAALAGRRSERAPSLRTPVVGAVVLAVGIATTTWGGINYAGFGSVLMTGGVVISMLGMILVVPALVAVVAKAAGRLPLPLRHATRDAARHRTRTVPAIAAVAATVAGVVALGIGNASDEAENRETYRPMAEIGTGMITREKPAVQMGDLASWDEVEAAARRAAPDADMRRVQGLFAGMIGQIDTYWSVEVPGGDPDTWFLSEHGGLYATSVLVDDEPFLDLPDEQMAEVKKVLAEGRAAVFTDQGVETDEVELLQRSYSTVGNGEEERGDEVTLPARTVEVKGQVAVQAVVPTVLAKELGDSVETVGLVLTSQVDKEAQEAIKQAVRGVDERSHVVVERGYERDPYAVVVLWVLGVAGALLMLAGTLTATFLSLTDARPDLATVSAVGGAPRTRRWVAASYALMIGAVGALLGAAVGFVPGIAVSRPLTSGYANEWGETTGPYLAIPWLLIGAVVVLLPLFSALVVWLSARSRLPMVARVD